METKSAAIHRKMLMLVSQLPITGSTHKAGNGRRPLAAATDIVRSARVWRAPSGSRRVRPSCCRCRTTTWSSPYHRRWRRSFQNKRAVYAILFHAAAEAMRDIAAEPRHLGAEIGAVAVLHTWGQTLQHHPHLHCIVPGGGLSPDQTRWVACRPGFFLPVRVLSRRFRTLFLARLQAAFSWPASCVSPARSPPWPSPTPSPNVSIPCARSNAE